MAWSKQAGFTLLEALVALTLLAVVGGGLLAWVSGAYKNIERIEHAERRLEAGAVALAYFDLLNPTAAPGGNVQLGPYRLEWRSVPISETRPTVGRHTGALGVHDVTLYRIEGRIGRNESEMLPLVLEWAGHSKAKDRLGGEQ